jgi:phytoene synthase
MEVLYAYMRSSDDLVDNPAPAAARCAALERWRAMLESALHGGSPAEDAGAPAGDGVAPADVQDVFDRAGVRPEEILPALAEVATRYAIPEQCLTEVLDGGRMDLDGRRYETFDELVEYCHCVASSVGLASIHIWGFRGPEAFGPARECGLAFQLTNILRDLKADADEGRLYLPLEDLRACGYNFEALRQGVADQRFFDLMRLQTHRAAECYRRGAELFDHLARGEGRRIFGMMHSTYYRLLRTIARAPQRVLSGRVRLGRLRKAAIALRWMFLPPRRSALP